MPLPVQNSVEITVDVCQEEEKEAKLAELLEDVLEKKTDRAVVFTERRWKVEKIAFQLRQRGWPTIGLRGKRDKEEREWVLSLFSSVAETVLVTTDVVVQDAELGKVRMVVNYDCPGCSKVTRTGQGTRSSMTNRAWCARSLFPPNIGRPILWWKFRTTQNNPSVLNSTEL